jgi:hypothetical protein
MNPLVWWDAEGTLGGHVPPPGESESNNTQQKGSN